MCLKIIQQCYFIQLLYGVFYNNNKIKIDVAYSKSGERAWQSGFHFYFYCL